MAEACDCTPSLNGLLSYEAALDRLITAAKPLETQESLGLRQALGRVAASAVHSTIDVPGWDYSAMDGYALRAQDCVIQGTRLPVSQRIPAGDSPTPLAPGTAARIFTGAPIPEGADCVVIQEVCEAGDGLVKINTAPSRGDNIRLINK